MAHPKMGDVVKFSAYSRTVNAIVLAAHYGEVSHHGKSGEPLLDLIYIDPDRESAIEKKQMGWHPRVFTEFSVVHHSHEFAADYKQAKGIATVAQLVAQRGAGEWQEIATEGPEFLAKLRAGEFDDEKKQSEAGKAIDMLGALLPPGEQRGIPVDHPDHLALIPGAPLFGAAGTALTPEQMQAFYDASPAAQPSGGPPPEQPIPLPTHMLAEGFTPIAGSKALTGYKYDEATRTFEVITTQGLRYKYENVEPERAQAFELAPSKGVAWNRLIKSPAAQLGRESRHNVAVGNDELGDR